MSSGKPLIQTKISFQRTDSTDKQSNHFKRRHSEISESEDTMSSPSAAKDHSKNSSDMDLGSSENLPDIREEKRKRKPEKSHSQSTEMEEDFEVIHVEANSSKPENDDYDNYSNGSHENDQFDIEHDKNPHYQDDTVKPLGCPFDELPRVPGCFKNPLPSLRNNPPHHLVYFVTTNKLKEAKELPRPLPGEYLDNWENDDEVKMPCSKGSTIPNPDAKNQDSRVMKRWELIEMNLKSDIKDSFNLEEVILKYNDHYRQRWNFNGLHYYFELCPKEERISFFTKVLPEMTKLALQLPILFTKGIPFLRQREAKQLTFSQQQVACLLANAFFCTFPRRNMRRKNGAFPDINFSSLFAGPKNEVKRNKIKCILHYFERVTKSMPKGVITYSRRVSEQKNEDWISNDSKLTKLCISSTGTIENTGRDMLQVDFANKYVGGGVLGHGCVQEEIRFLICPEMIVSRLFTEVLLKNEVLVMTGCERFSDYTGYAQQFCWNDDFVDEVERDEWGRRYTKVVAMDALSMNRSMNQFDKDLVIRELNKAYCGFEEIDRPSDQRATVCTGNWGCGAFGGDPELKALIQIMAASAANRDVCYLTVGNEKLCHELSEIHSACRENTITVGELFTLIMDFARLHKPSRASPTLLEFISINVL